MVLNNKKLIIFTTVPTHPQDMGCRRRIYNLLEEFENQGLEIHLIYFPLREKQDDLESIVLMKKRWKKIHIITKVWKSKSKKSFNFSLRRVDAFFGSAGNLLRTNNSELYSFLKPINKYIQKLTRLNIPDFKNNISPKKETNFVDFYYDQDAFDFVKKITEKLDPNIFICEYALYSFILKAVTTKTLKLIDTHDSIVKFTQLHGGKVLNLSDDFKVTIEMEKKLLSRADKAIAIQDEENNYFKSLLGKNSSITIGHKVTVKEQLISKNRNNLLFVGSDWMPNKNGINWFLKEVWPILKKSNNKIQLTIVGTVSKYIKKSKNIQIKGFVKDLEDEYNKTDVVICPIKEGSGLKIKAIESLGYARPIVGTEHIAEGFGPIVKKNDLFDVSNNPKQFAKKILNLLENDNLYFKRQKNGINFAKDYNRQQEKKIYQLIQLSKKIKNGKK